jgi:hypothetical protein
MSCLLPQSTDDGVCDTLHISKEKLRPNAFEVRGLNGVSTGIIHRDDAAVLSQWLKYVTDNIVGLTNLQLLMIQTHLDFGLLCLKLAHHVAN